MLNQSLKNKKLSVLFLSAAVTLTGFLSGCGDSDFDLDAINGDSSERVTDTLGFEESFDSENGANPLVRSTQFFGQNGNIYKPVSDLEASGGGNMVVLFSSAFTRQFESCSIIMGDGTSRALTCIDNQPWTQIPFSCFSNGNRQTWRADFKCSSVGSVVVTCIDLNQEITFTVPEGQEGNVCSRVG